MPSDSFFENEFIELMGALAEDVHRATTAMSEAGDQFSIRQYVRAAFALKEGLTHSMKRMALEVDDDERVLDAAERTVLAERAFDLNDQGQVTSRQATYPWLRSARFAFDAFAKAQGLNVRLDASGVGWARLREAVGIRNRITHPKSTADIAVSPPEAQTVWDANILFVQQLLDLMQAAAAHDSARSAELNMEFAAVRAKQLAAKAELRALISKEVSRQRKINRRRSPPPV
jgi:hypothetical protein